MGSKDDIHPGRLVDNRRLVFLGKAPPYRNLHPWLGALNCGELTEVSIELVIGVFAHGTRVDHDNVRGMSRLCFDIARCFERTRHALRIMNIHLTAKGANFECPPVAGIQGSNHRGNVVPRVRFAGHAHTSILGGPA